MRLNWTVAAAAAYDMTVVLLKGLKSVKTEAIAIDITGGGVWPVDSVGFKPSLVFFLSTGSADVGSGIDPHAILSFGAAHNSSSDVVTNAVIGLSDSDGVSSTSCKMTARPDPCAMQYFNGATGWQANAQGFDVDGFDLNVISGNTQLDFVFYLAIELDDPDDAYVAFIEAPTVNGIVSYTGVGFQPEGLFLVGADIVSFNNTINYINFDIGASDGVNEHCGGMTGQNAVFPGDEKSHSDDFLAHTYYRTGATTRHIITVDAFTADGFDLDYIDTWSSHREFLAIALKGGAGAPVIDFNPVMFGANF